MAAATTAQKSMAVPLTAFTVGAVLAVLVGVFGRVHDPSLANTTTLGFSTVIGMKVVVTTVVGVLAVLQVLGALWMYGKLGIEAPPWLGKAHRISGAITIVLALFVAYHCLFSLGLEYGTTADGYEVPVRGVVHGVLGCVFIGALVVKVTAVRSKRAPGWFLPVAGGLIFTVLIALVLTSAVWYLTTNGWPTTGSGGYS
jgi:hypothetical protein